MCLPPDSSQDIGWTSGRGESCVVPSLARRVPSADVWPLLSSPLDTTAVKVDLPPSLKQVQLWTTGVASR